MSDFAVLCVVLAPVVALLASLWLVLRDTAPSDRPEILRALAAVLKARYAWWRRS